MARGPIGRVAMLAAGGVAVILGALAVPSPRSSSAAAEPGLRPSPTIAPAPAVPPAPAPLVLAGPPLTAVVAPVPPPTTPPTTTAPVCRAVVLVHGGGYFFGDAGALEVGWAEPLRRSGAQVWNVDYPMLPDMPDVRYDEADPWYPRPDVDSTPPSLRTVHDRAADAVAPAVAEALATGCRVTLLGISAGGSIVADLAYRFPTVAEAVLVAGASITPDRLGGAPLRIFYGTLDETVLPAASLETCERWVAAGSSCTAVGLAGEAHVAPAVTDAALDHVLSGR